MIRRVAIIGVGLIGGSLALAWKERRSDLHTVGWDKQSVLSEALHRGAIDEAALSLKAAVRQADAVVLAVPLDAMERVLRKVAPHVRPGTLITDVGSVKADVMTAAGRLLPDTVSFIGGHPMAGAEHGGISNADAFLFENATYILCGNTQSTAFQMAADLVKSTGARVISLDPVTHDRIAACVSHVPQLVATALMDAVAACSTEYAASLRLAAGGFRDMTRIASSSFDTWKPILEANSGAITEVLSVLMDAFRSIAEALSEGRVDTLKPAFERARATRSKIPRDFKGFLAPLCDVYVYAEDKPGTLAHITNTLFASGINIKDIELLTIREGTGGAFRMSLVNESAADEAVRVLSAAGCRAHRLN